MGGLWGWQEVPCPEYDIKLHPAGVRWSGGSACGGVTSGNARLVASPVKGKSGAPYNPMPPEPCGY